MRDRYAWGQTVYLVANLQQKDNAAYKRLKKGEFAAYMVLWPEYHVGALGIPYYKVGYIDKRGRVSKEYDFSENELSLKPEAPEPVLLANYM